MFGIKKFLVLFVLSIFDRTQSLVQLPSVEENDILKTEASIRTTVNNLFSLLQLQDTQERSRIKQYTVVHNYFVSLTLQDYNTLKEIAQLTRVDKNPIQNYTTGFIALINEIIDEENVLEIENTTQTDIERFNYLHDELQKLQHLKTSYADPKIYVDIDAEVLRILESSNINDEVVNATTESAYSKDVLINSSSTPDAVESDSWSPSQDPANDGRRIYAGDRAKIKDYPFMASIEIFNKFQCGASIIEKDLLVTAASCLQLAWNNRFYRENPVFLSVRIGSDFYEIGGELIPVLEIYFYPSYVPRTLQNNIAVMRIVRHINFKKKKRVKKITLDENEHSLPYNTPGVLVLGWGAYTTSNTLHSPIETKLRKSILPIYGLNDCADVYSKQYVKKTNFCAGMISKGKGACNRDAGGPGVVGKHLVGIISFGSPVCGAPDSPTVFTKVGYYFDWIEEIIDQYVPQHKQRTTTEDPYPYYHITEPTKPSWYVTPVDKSKKGLDIAEVSEPTTKDVSQTTHNYNIKNTTFHIPQSNIKRNKHFARSTHILEVENKRPKHDRLKKINHLSHKKNQEGKQENSIKGKKTHKSKKNRDENFKSFLKTIFHDEEEIERYLEAIKQPLGVSQKPGIGEESNEPKLYTHLGKKSFDSLTLSGIKPTTTTEVTTKDQTIGMLQLMNTNTDINRELRKVVTENVFITILESQSQIQEQETSEENENIGNENSNSTEVEKSSNNNLFTNGIVQQIEKIDQQIKKLLDESKDNNPEEEDLSILWNTPYHRKNQNKTETITNVNPTVKKGLSFAFNNFMLNQQKLVPSTNDINTGKINKYITRRTKGLTATRPLKVKKNTQKQQKHGWTPGKNFNNYKKYNYHQSKFTPSQSHITFNFPINNTIPSQTWYQWTTINNDNENHNISEIALAQQGKIKSFKTTLSLQHKQMEEDIFYVLQKFKNMALNSTATEGLSKLFNDRKHNKKKTKPTIHNFQMTSKPWSFGDEVKQNMEKQLARFFKKEETLISNKKRDLSKLNSPAETKNYNKNETSSELNPNDERKENQGSITSAQPSEIELLEEQITTTPPTISNFYYTQPLLNQGNEVDQNIDNSLAKLLDNKAASFYNFEGSLPTLSFTVQTSYDDIESSGERNPYMNNVARKQKKNLGSMTSASITNVKLLEPMKIKQFTVPSTMKISKDHRMERQLAELFFMNMHELAHASKVKGNTYTSSWKTTNPYYTTASPNDMVRVPARTKNYNNNELNPNDERIEYQGSTSSSQTSEVKLLEEHITSTPPTIYDFYYTQPTVFNFQGSEVNQNMDISLANFLEKKATSYYNFEDNLPTLSYTVQTSYDDIESSRERNLYMNNVASKQKENLGSMTSASNTNVKSLEPMKIKQFTVPSTLKITEDHRMERELAELLFMNMHMTDASEVKGNTDTSSWKTTNPYYTTASPNDMVRIPAQTKNYNNNELKPNDERKENQGSTTSSQASEVKLLEEHITTTPSPLSNFYFTHPTVTNFQGTAVNQNMHKSLAEFFKKKETSFTNLEGDLPKLSSTMQTSYDDIESSKERNSYMNNVAGKQKENLGFMTSASITYDKLNEPMKITQLTVPSTMKITQDHQVERHLAELIYMNLHGLTEISKIKGNTDINFWKTTNPYYTTASPNDMARVPEVEGSTYTKFWKTNDYFHITKSPSDSLLPNQTKENKIFTVSTTQDSTFTEQPLLEAFIGDVIKDVSQNQDNNGDTLDNLSVSNLSKEQDTLETYNENYLKDRFIQYSTKTVETTPEYIISSLQTSITSKFKNYIPNKVTKRNYIRYQGKNTPTSLLRLKYNKSQMTKNVYKKNKNSFFTKKSSPFSRKIQLQLSSKSRLKPTFTYFPNNLNTSKYIPGAEIITDRLSTITSTPNPITQTSNTLKSEPVTKIIIEIPYTIPHKVNPKVTGNFIQPIKEINIMNLSDTDKLNQLAKIVEVMVMKPNQK